MRVPAGNALLPEPTASTSAANSGLPQDVAEDKDAAAAEDAAKGASVASPLYTQRSHKGDGDAAPPAQSAIKGSAVYRYSVEDLKLMKEFPNSKLPMDPKSQLAQIMSKMTNRRSDGYKGGASRGFGGEDLGFHQGPPQQHLESQGSLLGMPGNLRAAGPLSSKTLAGSGVAGDGIGSFNKSLSLGEKLMESAEGGPGGAAVGQVPAPRAAATRQNSGFPPPPPPPPEKDAEAANGFLPGGSNPSAAKQVDAAERPSSITLGATAALPAETWNSQQPKVSRPVLPTAQDLIFPTSKPPHSVQDLFAGARNEGLVSSPNDMGHLEQPQPVYDYYGQRFGDSMQFGNSGLNMWNGQEQDLWDSPVEGGDNDIFTLGDIRQAEHTIETQGISAESYADLRTRKILSDVAERSKPRNEATDGSQDLFFFDNNPRLPPEQRGGESRFLGMFETNQNNQRMPPMRSYQTQGVMNSNYMQQFQPSAATNGPAQWNTSVPPTVDRSPDKAMMREHLLKILGLRSGADAKPTQAPPQELLYKQHQAAQQQQQQQQQQPVYPPMGASAAPTRPSNTIFSRPLNPAAPQFSPLGIFNNLNTDSHSLKKNLPGIPPPPPPTDYRRQAGLYEHLQAPQAMQQMAPNTLFWNQRNLGNQQHPIEGAGMQQEVDLPQRLAAAKAAPKQQSPQISEQQAVAAAQFLQRHLMANANLTPEQIQQVMHFFNKNKGTLLASQLLMANQNAAARRKEFEVESLNKEQQAAALLHSAAAQLRQQSVNSNANKGPQMPPAQAAMQPTNPQLNTANSQLQVQIQAVQKALQASVARAQAGARGGHTAQEMQRLVTTLQQLQQKSSFLQQQQQQQQAMLSQQQLPRRPMAAAQPVSSPALSAQQQQQQKYQQQVCLANAIEQLTAMAQRIKTQQQQQVPTGVPPDMSPQQLISAAQKQLQHKQAAQQQHPFGPPPTQGAHLYEQHQAAQRAGNGTTPSNELKQQLTSALTTTIQQNPTSKSEQAAANLSALLKNLPPNHNLSQQIHAMLAQQQQNAANPNRPPSLPPSGHGPSMMDVSQLLKPEVVAKPSEAGAAFKSDADGPAEGSDKENGLGVETLAEADVVKGIAKSQENEQQMASSSD
eukprot:Gregarina_sp_Pseudo_9__501@NODE_131_length_4101_cov_12_568932_g123_i0_p1_GENE_NODE_131_length_4101_cov_12_568932_g123_i0NODE_131_length_4101_cov_12_568932_g123_i0_p1_ORF_typecomplete_len1118_score268_16Rap1a/PF18602_1/1_8e02Rap1a/PF18602_1/9_6_NODE_131_length_4101_cov_12_568932_g123_i06594012